MLGEVKAARSRHAGRRSAVALTDGLVVAGRADGSVVAFDRTSDSDGASAGADASLTPRWESDPADEETSIVAAEPFAGAVAVGERGPRGSIALHDPDDGSVHWRYAADTDVGSPQKRTRFFLPFVADLAAHGDRLNAAVRRYERDGEARHFESCVYAFEPDGTVAWRYVTDASPISITVDGDRVAVAYNRCPGEHDSGLGVLDSVDGTSRWTWDPGTDGQRRVGDVELLPDGVAVASHGDYRGYRLDTGGEERWAVDLATPLERGDQTLYAYANHVHASEDTVAFVTGNTYAEESRETDALHPNEHTCFVCDRSDGDVRWQAPVGGFATEVSGSGGHLAIPGAQHFRDRDPAYHGLRIFDLAAYPAGTDDAGASDSAPSGGEVTTTSTDGIVTAVDTDADHVAWIEEPVVYHDDGVERGAYQLSIESTTS
jgi:outer membrane protein assembly factor BamB